MGGALWDRPTFVSPHHHPVGGAHASNAYGHCGGRVVGMAWHVASNMVQESPCRSGGARHHIWRVLGGGARRADRPDHAHLDCGVFRVFDGAGVDCGCSQAVCVPGDHVGFRIDGELRRGVSCHVVAGVGVRRIVAILRLLGDGHVWQGHHVASDFSWGPCAGCAPCGCAPSWLVGHVDAWGRHGPNHGRSTRPIPGRIAFVVWNCGGVGHLVVRPLGVPRVGNPPRAQVFQQGQKPPRHDGRGGHVGCSPCPVVRRGGACHRRGGAHWPLNAVLALFGAPVVVAVLWKRTLDWS